MHRDAWQLEAQLAQRRFSRPARSRRMALHRPCGRCTREQPHALRKPVASARALSGLPMHDQDSLTRAIAVRVRTLLGPLAMQSCAMSLHLASTLQFHSSPHASRLSCYLCSLLRSLRAWLLSEGAVTRTPVPPTPAPTASGTTAAGTPPSGISTGTGATAATMPAVGSMPPSAGVATAGSGPVAESGTTPTGPGTTGGTTVRRRTVSDEWCRGSAPARTGRARRVVSTTRRGQRRARRARAPAPGVFAAARGLRLERCREFGAS
jgi:hypothetical protein